MSPAEQIYQKSLRYAKWSYIGLLIPILGIVLSSISQSLVKIIQPRTHEDKRRIEKLFTISKWGFFVSLWPIWVFAIICIVSIIAGLFGIMN